MTYELYADEVDGRRTLGAVFNRRGDEVCGCCLGYGTSWVCYACRTWVCAYCHNGVCCRDCTEVG